MSALEGFDDAVLAQTGRELKESAAEHGYVCETLAAPDQGHIEWQPQRPDIVRKIIDGLERKWHEHS
ncbi:hypothetical protein ABZ746_17245 [Streptomyces sp. NPDC020096]